MQAAETTTWISAREYLEAERGRKIRHEYVCGQIYAMAGASAEHNLICLNIAAAIRNHLQGKQCKVFMADLKVRLEIGGELIFYYPDLLVTCDKRDTDRFFKQFPIVLVEVLSPETERTDRREKFLNYIQIPSVEEYVLVAQDKIEVSVFRRAAQWQPELLSRLNQKLRLSSLGFAISLKAVYEGVER
jgi:Uma2 family endonuclease